MLQNKIYLNFLSEIFKTFLIVLFGLSLIALTVRAVNFLDLIVDSGYPVSTYFQYSVLNLFGIAPKFIPLSFLIALTIFILKHVEDSEFIILWTSGEKKMKLVNLLFFSSIITMIFYLVLTTVVTPTALNKSRKLLSYESLNSFLPTVRSQQFSDSFKGFTFIVEKKINNEIKNIFLHDKGNNLKNLSSNISKTSDTTILARNGLIDNRKLYLFNGQILTSKNDKSENEIIKFEQLNIDLGDLTTTTIKQPKIQETSTIKLFDCLFSKSLEDKSCNSNYKREIMSNLNRRIIIPFYIPVISLICCLLLIKSKNKSIGKIGVFSFSFILLIFTELAVRYTGLNTLILFSFVSMPLILTSSIYIYLIYKFSRISNIS